MGRYCFIFIFLFLWIKILEAVAALNAARGKSGIIVRPVFPIQSAHLAAAAAASVDVDAVFVVAYVTV